MVQEYQSLGSPRGVAAQKIMKIDTVKVFLWAKTYLRVKFNRQLLVWCTVLGHLSKLFSTEKDGI